MTIVSDQPDSATRLIDWCGTVRALHEEHVAPLDSISDYRFQQFIAATEDDQHNHIVRNEMARWMVADPLIAARMYFERCIPIPTPPVGVPEWSVSQEVAADGWPEVRLTFRSETIEAGSVIAWAERSVSYVVADLAKGSSDNPFAGDHKVGTVKFDDEASDVTLFVDGHPFDMYGASVQTVKQAAAAMLLVATTIEAGESK